MLEQAASLTPTITITFDHQSITTPSNVFEYKTSTFSTCLKVPRSLLLEEKSFPTAQTHKRRRLACSPRMATKQREDRMEEEGVVDSLMSPISPVAGLQPLPESVTPSIFSRLHQSSSHTPATPVTMPHLDNVASAFVSQQQHADPCSDMIADKDIAGPSRIGLAFRQDLGQGALQGGPSRLGSRIRKKPTKLTLPSSPPNRRSDSSNTLQVKEISGHGSRSVPSSPMLYSQQNDDAQQAEDGREQLRATLRGTPRRRPSVPFGLRAAKLPSLSIPVQSARLSSQNLPSSRHPPPVWQDPSEHILSGNGSSLQHARSVYASGPVEVLPGLFLGDEFNARDDDCLSRLGITTILNVAKETTLPFQTDAANEPLDFLGPSSLTRGLQKSLTLSETVITPTSSTHTGARSSAMADNAPPKTAARETFFTPATSMHPASGLPISLSTAALSPKQPTSSFYLRSTTSTPNLHSHFTTARTSAEERSSMQTTTDEEDDEEERAMSFVSSTLSANTPGSSPPSPVSKLPADLSIPRRPSSSTYSTANLSITTPSSSGDQSIRSIATTSTGASSSSSGSYHIALPHNAVALNVPPSPLSGRGQGLRYIKLPWTHDETELAGTGAGGFITGCSIIADTLGIDLITGQSADGNAGGGGGGVLVHCQCGVSRSATLVIAFVMQAAACNYRFEATQRLTGMHDCYEMVKELSSSISPNCSLIYQLVEWERYLSRQVAESAATLGSSAATLPVGAHATPSGEAETKKWGNEAMNEEDWTRMRLDEERKEREEEERVRESRVKEDMARQTTQPAQGVLPAAIGAKGGTGLGARRKRPTPSLTLTSSAKSSADQAIKASSEADANPARYGSSALPAMQEEEDREEAMMDVAGGVPESEAATVRLAPPSTVSTFALSPALTSASMGNSSAGSFNLASDGKPHSPGAFGAHRQSAAERRNKHKRTFSSELPSWNRSLSITTSASQDTTMAE